MSIMLLTIAKSIGGHKWENTYGVFVGMGNGVPTAADLTTIGMGAQPTTAQMVAGGGTNLVQRLIGFERAMTAADVNFDQVYVTDGKKAKNDPTASMYAILNINITGAYVDSGGAVFGERLLPGNVSLMIHRNISGFSHKPGRLFLRGALIDADVKVGGPRMVDWNGGALGTITTRLANALSTSLLSTHFQAGSNANTGSLGVPIYVTARTLAANPGRVVGDMVDSLPITGMQVAGVVGRQVNRGRKKKAA